MEKVHDAIIRRNNILKLKEKEETLEEQVREALEQDDPNINRATAIYAKKMSHMLRASTSYRGERFQNKVFEKLVCEPLLNGVMPNFVVNRKTL
jgi:lysyl-tRNA synthetase class II